MKTILVAAAFCLFTAATLRPQQQQYDVTVRDGNRLKPGASQKEIADWMTSRAIESAFAAAMQPQTQSPRLSPEQIQAMKLVIIRAAILDQLLKTHPALKAEADALYVQYDTQFSQALLKAQSGGR